MFFESEKAEDTYEFGKKLAKKAKPGELYCLDGDLGAGKTVFAAGFAAGLGIKTPICSPTFTILQVYDEGRLPLYHFDVYRIGDISEMDETGFEEYAFGQGVCLIEWGSLIKDILPGNTVYIRIERDAARGGNYRKIIYEASCD